MNVSSVYAYISTLIFIKHKQNRSFLAVKMGMSQQPFEKISYHLAELPVELKNQLCKHVIHAPKHNYNQCNENTEETPFMEAIDE
uniref:Uncharacterized protein n=1 Tax=Lactuca sativa TaxID=4236 RepID=A0A9R1XPL0_LACSA|nr:hypothetical protein LSAT_V11C200090770 [Lactuca sativa]